MGIPILKNVTPLIQTYIFKNKNEFKILSPFCRIFEFCQTILNSIFKLVISENEQFKFKAFISSHLKFK